MVGDELRLQAHTGLLLLVNGRMLQNLFALKLWLLEFPVTCPGCLRLTTL